MNAVCTLEQVQGKNVVTIRTTFDRYKHSGLKYDAGVLSCEKKEKTHTVQSTMIFEGEGGSLSLVAHSENLSAVGNFLPAVLQPESSPTSNRATRLSKSQVKKEAPKVQPKKGKKTDCN